ncbi:VOC family protein [uncultured Proteiniphilum sp.]|uniref:VOC family protein n=1 Tax=uncultured Proteiniphilum sp. TaxID=497637 RepID=UPI002622B176|nr:VOC family protein [uncultured Proteiniphilum sp.]
MKLKDLSITFHTEKIKECVDFYSKYLRAKVSFDTGWYVSIHLQSDINPYIYISFQGNPDGRAVKNLFTGGITLNLMVEDVDACWEKLRQTDITFVEEITDHEWGNRAFSLYDPIGNLVYVYSERPLHEKYKDAVKG